MRTRTRWINVAAVLLLVGCESHPFAPDESTFVQARVSRQDVASEPVALGAPRWLILRPDGMYDDQGRRRLSRAKVNALHIDQAFELHRKAKLQWINQGARSSRRDHGSVARPSANAATATIANPQLTIRPNVILTAPSGPRLAVAADDPCFFDATIWCSNEYGGELGGGGSGGGSYSGAAPTDDGSLDCSFIRTNMANAWAAYVDAQRVYMELAGWVTDAPFSNGVMEGALEAQYSKMQSYLADYNLWRGLATRYKCS